MAHEVEQMFFVGETPWHGLGNRIIEAPTVDDAIKQAGLDWMVRKEQIFLGNGQEAKNHKAIVRNSDDSILGCVGNRYEPLQNIDAFAWFQPFLDSGEATLETGGSLSQGKKIWILARLQGNDIEIGRGDKVRKFILLSNSHDGTQAIRCGFVPIRVVCANTLGWAHNCKSSQLVRVRHTGQAVQNLEDLRGIMNTANASFEASATQFQKLANSGINGSDLEKYVTVALGYAPSPIHSGELVFRKAVDELSSRAKNQISQVCRLTSTGRGMDLETTKGTLWGAYNAVSEYLSHHASSSGAARYNSLWFGNNAKRNDVALEYAIQLADQKAA